IRHRASTRVETIGQATKLLHLLLREHGGVRRRARSRVRVRGNGKQMRNTRDCDADHDQRKEDLNERESALWMLCVSRQCPSPPCGSKPLSIRLIATDGPALVVTRRVAELSSSRQL